MPSFRLPVNAGSRDIVCIHMHIRHAMSPTVIGTPHHFHYAPRLIAPISALDIADFMPRVPPALLCRHAQNAFIQRVLPLAKREYFG